LETRPLAGRGIVVTRPREHAGLLAEWIEQAGGVAHRFPAIEIQPLPDASVARALLERLDEFELAIFISPAAVEKGFELIPRWPPDLHAAAVGAGTRAGLERHGVQHVLVPGSGAGSESLLALPELEAVAGKRILIVRGEGGREVLGDTLASRGARVQYAECYRRARPRVDARALLRAWSKGEVDAVTVSSSTGLANLFAMLGAPGRPLLQQTALFVPHARVADAANRAGARNVLVAGPGDREVVERLVAYFKGP
jgi:uroporphyrinogen-III synthase